MAARGLHRTDPWKDTGTRGALLSNPFVWLKFYTNLFVWLAFNASGIKTSAISRPAFSGSCSLFHQSNHLTIKWNQNVFFNFFMHGRSHGRQGTTREILNFKILTKIWALGSSISLSALQHHAWHLLHQLPVQHLSGSLKPEWKHFFDCKRKWLGRTGETTRTLSSEQALWIIFFLSTECLIGKKNRNPNKINTHSFSCSTFNQSAFFKAGILVLQLNLLCCLCFARTPMQ